MQYNNGHIVIRKCPLLLFNMFTNRFYFVFLVIFISIFILFDLMLLHFLVSLLAFSFVTNFQKS